jgi:hypothetical protein
MLLWNKRFIWEQGAKENMMPIDKLFQLMRHANRHIECKNYVYYVKKYSNKLNKAAIWLQNVACQ